MAITKENLFTTSKGLRSPFSVSALEIIVAILAAVISFYGLKTFLYHLLPSPCGYIVNNNLIPCGWTEEKSWRELGLPLFSKYILHFILLNALAAIFFLRAIRQDVPSFSCVGSIALAWPLVALPGMHLFPLYIVSGLFLGFVWGVLAMSESMENKQHTLDWVSLPINLWSIAVCWMYYIEYLDMYGG